MGRRGRLRRTTTRSGSSTTRRSVRSRWTATSAAEAERLDHLVAGAVARALAEVRRDEGDLLDRPRRSARRRRAAGPTWSPRPGRFIRARVRCGRKRWPSTSAPDFAHGGPRTGRPSGAAPRLGRSRHRRRATFALPDVGERATAGDPRLDRAAACGLPGRAGPPGRRTTGRGRRSENASVRCHCSGWVQRNGAARDAARRTPRGPRPRTRAGSPPRTCAVMTLGGVSDIPMAAVELADRRFPRLPGNRRPLTGRGRGRSAPS